MNELEYNAAAATAYTGALRVISKAPEVSLRIPSRTLGGIAVWATGLYLVTAGKRVGKSVVTRAILSSAAGPKVSMTGALYMYESGAPNYYLEEQRLFRKPSSFITEDGAGELDQLITTLQSNLTSDAPGMLVLDSISDPMRGFMGEMRGKLGSTAKEGMQPADQLFVKVLDSWAVAHRLVVLGVVNEDLVPFVNLLEAACQGMVFPQNVTSFKKLERATGRQVTTHSLLPLDVANGLSLMGYDRIVQTSNFADIITSL